MGWWTPQELPSVLDTAPTWEERLADELAEQERRDMERWKTRMEQRLRRLEIAVDTITYRPSGGFQ